MRRFLLVVAVLILRGSPAWSAEWLTGGGDVQRDHWQRDETRITSTSVKNMKLLWKIHLDNEVREMHALLPPLVIDRVNTSSGPKQLVIETGVSDNIFAIVADTGTLLWKRHFEYTSDREPAGKTGFLCPGGTTATPVVGPTDTPGKYTIYAASWDGNLHQLNAADGTDVKPPTRFMPSNGKPYALNLYKNVIYTHTAEVCGGNPNTVYAYDLATDKVGTWGPASGGMWGRTGPAIDSKGVMYTGIGDGPWDPENGVFGSSFIGVKQDPETKALKLGDYYTPTNAEYLNKRDQDIMVTPAIFPYKGRELMVSAGKECRIYLMDTESIGGDDHRTPVYRTPLICNEEVNFMSAGIWGSMASWEESDGTRWVVTPFWGPKHSKFHAPVEYGEVRQGAVAAFKVEDVNGKTMLVPAWISRDMDRAEPPVIANGVVFGFGSGEDTTQAYFDVGFANVATRRIADSTHAVLYALDARTGKELWNSADEISSWNHWSELAVASGRVYINTYENILYCYGIPQ
jgi:outer membrane protein assembly factor BamB